MSIFTSVRLSSSLPLFPSSPLPLSLQVGNVEAARSLAERGADMAVNKKGQGPLEVAREMAVKHVRDLNGLYMF